MFAQLSETTVVLKKLLITVSGKCFATTILTKNNY